VRAFCTLAYQIAWRFARHKARDIPPEELVCEALCGLTYAASMFKENRGVPFAAYAALVVRHRLTNAIRVWRRQKWGRRRLVKVRTDGGWDPEDPRSADVCADTAAREMCERIRCALPSRWYAVLHLYYANGLTFQEVGEQLGISRERVRQLHNQAVRHTRKEFPEWIQRAGIRT